MRLHKSLLQVFFLISIPDANAFLTSPTTALYRPSTILHMDTTPLAKEGPWTAYLDDETTGLIYYFNSDTGESVWDPPTDTFPEIKLNKVKEQKMKDARLAYNQERLGMGVEVEKEEKKGFFGFFKESTSVEPVAEEQVVVQQEEVEQVQETIQEQESTNWFGGFFGKAKTETVETVPEEEEVMEEMEMGQEEEEYYDQSMFEDAVVVVEDEQETPTAKKSFVQDIMAFTSFPSAKPKEAEPVTIPQPLTFEIGSKVLPHPEKISWGGEDALFVKGRSFGLFDGVSGAEKTKGVPLYSTTLANQLKAKIETDQALAIEDIKRDLLTAAEYADFKATGASTAIVASIGDDDVMRSLCLGDSVLMVIRNGVVFSKTKETTHYFDCPYQLSEDSPDRPRDGTVLTTRLMPGDKIVTGSDGVFDNLTADDIIQIIQENEAAKASTIAQKIVAESRAVSLDKEAPTPYAKQAKRNRYKDYATGLGGKVDDISCIVVSVNA